MADYDLMPFNLNTNNAHKFSSPLMKKNVNPDVANLRKRKLFTGVAEDMGLPTPKHKCCEADVDSEHDLSTMDTLGTDDVHTSVDSAPCVTNVGDAQLDSAQDSNSFHGDAQSAYNEGQGNTDSYDEASTPWDNSGSVSSRNRSIYAESSILTDKNDVKEEEPCFNQDTGWHDIDGLEECISMQYCQDTSEQTTEKLHEFLSSSEVDPDIFGLPSDGWGSKQETQPGTHKPTIDQEFEQYFSTLML